MLTLSIVWLVLASAVTIIATARRRTTASHHETRTAEAGSALAILAIAYGIILLAGFVYVGWHQSAGLIR